jgi:DNA-binding Lrp family transcriptional regulator
MLDANSPPGNQVVDFAPGARPRASWRNDLPIHPAADLFPRMSPDELRELGKDIIKNGLTSPIAVCIDSPTDRESVQLVDGRNRLDAMELAGLHFKLKWNSKTDLPHLRWKDPDGVSLDPFSPVHVIMPEQVLAYVISANLRRRHLSIEDKDRLIVQLLKGDPTKSNRQVAKLTDTSHPHVAKVREQAEKSGDVETVTTSIDTTGRKQPARKTTTKPSSVPKEVPQERAAAEERIQALMGGEIRDDVASESAGGSANDEQARLRHFECQNIELRSEVKELKAQVRDLESRGLQAVSVEKLVDELDRRPEAAFLKKPLDAIRRTLAAPGRHLELTLALGPDSVTDNSEPIKH